MLVAGSWMSVLVTGRGGAAGRLRARALYVCAARCMLVSRDSSSCAVCSVCVHRTSVGVSRCLSVCLGVSVRVCSEDRALSVLRPWRSGKGSVRKARNRSSDGPRWGLWGRGVKNTTKF